MRWHAACALLLLCLLVPAAPGADITFTAGHRDYYFLVGQLVEIPLAVASNYPEGMPGTVRFSTDAQLQKTGVIMISTENRVFSTTVPAGRSFLNLTMAPSKVSRDYKVHFSFYTTSPSPVNTSMPELFVHIVADPGLVKNSTVSLESTQPAEGGEIPAKSSVSIAEQTVSTRQQMGSDSTGQQSIASGQPQPDTEAERQQQQLDKERREREQAEFDGRLEKDPLVVAVNESLIAEGFTRQTRDTQPAGNNTGTFSMVYRKGAEDQVVVQGSMLGGVVPSVNEVSNTDIATDPALVANTTFQSFGRTLREQEYRHTETAINRTLTSLTATITYATPDGKKAFVNATTEHNRVVQVTLEEETGPAASCWSLFSYWLRQFLQPSDDGYRKYSGRRLPAPEDLASSPPPNFDYRKEAERLLSDAELAYEQHRFSDAYGGAGRALRIFLSYEYGNRGEVTTAEIVSLLRTSGRDSRNIEALLSRCDAVVFARQEPDTAEFTSLILHIREIITAS